MSPARRTIALLLATGLGLGLAGCGGSDPETKGPASSSPSSPTPTPTTSVSPTPTPTQPPLSRFENRPPVKAARAMATRLGRAVNANDRSMARLGNTATAHGKKALADISKVDFGNYFPGPQPFTPIAVRTSGDSAVVNGCWWSYGWSQNPTTNLPARKRRIDPTDIKLVRVSGQWRVDRVVLAKNNCSQVPVKGLPW